MNFLPILLTLLPQISPLLRQVTKGSPAEQLVDLLDGNMGTIQSFLGNVAKQDTKPFESIIANLIDKLPGSNQLHDIEAQLMELTSKIEMLLDKNSG